MLSWVLSVQSGCCPGLDSHSCALAKEGSTSLPVWLLAELCSLTAVSLGASGVFVCFICCYCFVVLWRLPAIPCQMRFPNMALCCLTASKMYAKVVM